MRAQTFNSTGKHQGIDALQNARLDLTDHFGSHSPDMEAVKKWMIEGYHPIEIWGFLLGKDKAELASFLQVSEDQYDTLANHPQGAFFGVTPDQIHEFCWQIGRHPAELVPFSTDPHLSLPRSILLANLLIVDGTLVGDEDHKLAMKAIAVEEERYLKLSVQDDFCEQLENLLHYASCGLYNQSVIRAGMKRFPIRDFFQPYQNVAYIGGEGDFQASNIAPLMMEILRDFRKMLQKEGEGRLHVLDHDILRLGNDLNAFVGQHYSHLTMANFEKFSDDVVRHRDEWTTESLSDFLADAYYDIGSSGTLSRVMKSVNRHLTPKETQPDFEGAAQKAVQMYCLMSDREMCLEVIDDRDKQIAQLDQYIPWLYQPEAAFVRSLVANKYTLSEWMSGNKGPYALEGAHILIRRDVG